MIGKNGLATTGIDLIVGLILIVSGVTTIYGNINLGVVLASIGLLIEAVKVIFQQGL